MPSFPPDPTTTNTLVPGGALNLIQTQVTQPQLTTVSNAQSTTTPDQSASTTANSNNAAVSPDALPTNDQPLIDPTTVDRSNYIQSNPFDNYIDVTYGVSVAMLSKSAADAVAESPVSSQPQGGSDVAGVTADDYQVFASTGESKTNRDASAEYYNIKSLSFTSFLGHYPQNPMVATMADMKITMFEPYGCSLRADIETMRNQLGWPDVEPSNYTYRIEIWFSGYDPKTGQWKNNIPIPLTNSINLQSVVYYVVISTIEATVTTQGTEYYMSLQMVSHRTMRAESIIYRMQTTPAIPQSGQSAQGQAQTQAQNNNGAGSNSIAFGSGTTSPTFGDFIANLEYLISQQVKYDTMSGQFPGLNVIYKVTGPSWLMNATFDTSGKLQISHGGVSYNPDSGTYTMSGQDVDILTLLYNIMDQIPIVRQLMTREDDTQFLYPSVTWNIRSSLQFTGQANSLINGYDGYTFNYFIEPVLSYRSRTTLPESRNDRVDPSAQQQRAQNMMSYGMIIRQYDFIFTNDNTEVIDLQLKDKLFYQEPYPSQLQNPRTQYQQGDNANMQAETGQTQNAQVAPQQQSIAATGLPVTAQSLTQMLGQSVPPQSSTSTGSLTAPQKHQGMVRQGQPQLEHMAQLGSAQGDMALYQYSKQQYFRYDMFSINMTVRFDPTWLLNPYMANGDYTPRMNFSNGTAYMNIDRAIFINAGIPVQQDYMNPYRTGATSANIFIGGLYQVLSVVNDFDGGRFIQKLSLMRYTPSNGLSSLSFNSSPSAQYPLTATAGPEQTTMPTQQQPRTLSQDPTVVGTRTLT